MSFRPMFVLKNVFLLTEGRMLQIMSKELQEHLVQTHKVCFLMKALCVCIYVYFN